LPDYRWKGINVSNIGQVWGKWQDGRKGFMLPTPTCPDSCTALLLPGVQVLYLHWRRNLQWCGLLLKYGPRVKAILAKMG